MTRPTPEELAALLDGTEPEPVLTPDDAAVLDALRAARGRLHELAEDGGPGGPVGRPEQMPDDVAARLDAALAAAPRPAAPDAGRAGTVTMLPRRVERRSRLPQLSAAAAVVVLVLVGGGLLLARGGSGDSGPEGAAGTASAAPAAGASVIVAGSGATYADNDALDAGVRGLLAGALTPASAPQAAAVRSALGGVAAGTAAAPRSAAAAASPAPSPTAAPGAPAAGGPVVPTDLARCLRTLDPDRPLLAVDSIVYAGQPSFLAVFDDEPGQVAAYVVGTACDAAGPSGLRAVTFVRVG